MTDSGAPPFGTVLRRFRRAAGLTQEELAERAGLSVRTISDLERGLKVTPQAATLELLADALVLSPTDRQTLLASVPRRHHGGSPQSGARRPSLPADVTPLIGRERDEAAAVHLLQSPGVRFLTLIGPGGVGKTRLALRVAGTLAGRYADGVYFIPLAPVTDPSLVADAIAAELGVRGEGQRSAAEALEVWLREREVLLVLDNFEHLADAALLVSNLLASCPRLTILATSRSPLRLRGEHLLDVPPLRVPAAGERPAAEVALRYSAIALFVQRAQAARADFALTDAMVEPVAGICHRLDSLPLALELAAAQVRHMSVEALLRRLQRGVQTLPPGPVDAPLRQQTMRDTIAWSYDLLDAAEQRLFRQLSVFVGGCSLEAAEAVSGEAGADTLTSLTALADKNLVLLLGDNPEPRFSMLETVREHSIERAAAEGEAAALRERHAEYYRQLAAVAGQVQRETGPSRWSSRLLADHPNLRAALQWLAESGRVDEALDMAADLVEYWIPWGYVREGRDWTERLLERAGEGTSTGPVEVSGFALVGAGRLASIQGDYARATAYYEAAAAVHRRNGNARDEAVVLNNLGTVAHMHTDYDRAVGYYERALALARAIDHRYGMAMPLTNLGIIAMQRGDYPRAAALFDEALLLWRAMGYDQKLAVTLGNRGALAFRQGQYDEATALQEEALAMKRAMGDRLAVAHSLGDLARAEIERGQHARALTLLEEALAIFHDAGQKDGIAECLEAMARLAQRTDQLDRAARLYGGAAALRADIGVAHHPADVQRHEEALAALRAAMSPGSFLAAWKIGQAMPLERLVGYAAVASPGSAGTASPR